MSKIFKATCGSMMYLYTHEDKDQVVDQILKKARHTGEAAFFPHAKVFYTKDPIVDLTKSGSDQYIWAKDSNRVKCTVVKHTIYKGAGPGIDNTHDKEEVGTVYADLN